MRHQHGSDGEINVEAEVLGGQVVLEENPCMIKLSNSWPLARATMTTGPAARAI